MRSCVFNLYLDCPISLKIQEEVKANFDVQMDITLNTPSYSCSSRTYLPPTQVISGKLQRGASHGPTTQMVVLGTTRCSIASCSSSHSPILLASPKTGEEALPRFFGSHQSYQSSECQRNTGSGTEGRRMISSSTQSSYLSPKQLCLLPESPQKWSLPHTQNLIKAFCQFLFIP